MFHRFMGTSAWTSVSDNEASRKAGDPAATHRVRYCQLEKKLLKMYICWRAMINLPFVLPGNTEDTPTTRVTGK